MSSRILRYEIPRNAAHSIRLIMSGGLIRIAWVASGSDRAGFSTSSFTNRIAQRGQTKTFGIRGPKGSNQRMLCIGFVWEDGRRTSRSSEPTFLAPRRAGTVRSGVVNFQTDLLVPTPPALASKLRFLGRARPAHYYFLLLDVTYYNGQDSSTG